MNISKWPHSLSPLSPVCSAEDNLPQWLTHRLLHGTDTDHFLKSRFSCVSCSSAVNHNHCHFSVCVCVCLWLLPVSPLSGTFYFNFTSVRVCVCVCRLLRQTWSGWGAATDRLWETQLRPRGGSMRPVKVTFTSTLVWWNPPPVCQDDRCCVFFYTLQSSHTQCPVFLPPYFHSYSFISSWLYILYVKVNNENIYSELFSGFLQ